MVEEFKTTAQGKAAEQVACDYLQQHGLVLLSKNYICRLGEIDLIMRETDTIVFVEVRLRHYSYLGSAIETVTPAKQRKLIKTALLYLQKNRWLDKVNTRFDVIGINANQIQWIKNAFSIGFV